MPQDYLTISSTSIPRGTADPDIYVDTYEPERTWSGTTLLADYHKPERPRIVEVNMLGEIVWEYVLPENLRQYTNPGFDVELLPNDNVLFLLPFNGLYEIDRDGNVVWSYLDEKVSHDADRLPNGNTLVVFGGDDQIGDAQVKEINPEGEIAWAWYAKDHFYNSPFKDIYEDGWTHTNAVTRLPNGNTLISLRNFVLTVEVDPQGSVVWSFDWRNLGIHPHEPEILSNGNILIALDERPGPGGPNKAIEIDRKTGEIVWEFGLLAGIRDADRLPNGNTLILGGLQILEVTPDGEVVWQLGVEGVLGDEGDHGKWFYKAERIGMVAPQISIVSPQSRTYESEEIDVSIEYSDVDLDTIWYRVYDRSGERWVTDELTYLRNKWANAITFDGTETGVRKITLEDGDYTLYAWANSTGWGDENLYQRKVVNVAEASVNFSVLAKVGSTISVSASPTTITVGAGITISGSISPVRAGVTVTLQYRPSGGTWSTLATETTDADGGYSYTWTLTTAGTYEVKASWAGDILYEGAESSVIAVAVERIATSMTIAASDTAVTEGEPITITGSIEPALLDSILTLTFTKPDGSTATETVRTNPDGSYTFTFESQEAGDWSVEASWPGDTANEEAVSTTFSFEVVRAEAPPEEGKKCIIATATYGSELSPEVQFLRGFRDNTVLNTFAGRSFMAVFNAWYYSFSPKVASIIAVSSALRGLMKILLYPLIGILHLAANTGSLFSFNPELAVIASGLVASSLIGLVYFAPCVLIPCLIKKIRVPVRVLHIQWAFLISSVGGVMIAEVIRWPGFMMLSTAIFVLTTISLATLSSARYLMRIIVSSR